MSSGSRPFAFGPQPSSRRCARDGARRGRAPNCRSSRSLDGVRSGGCHTAESKAGRLVTKEELLARVWPETFVEEGILTVHVSNLRRVLDDPSSATTCIETVARFGYRFVASVTPVT
jgi:hypothetical protein